MRISKIKLRKLFGPHWFLVINTKPAGKGWYEVEELPSLEDFKKALYARCSYDPGDLVEEAKSDLEGLKDELQDWYDNLPEGFQNGGKGDLLNEAINTLDSLSIPDLPDFLSEAGEGDHKFRVVCIPGIDVSSRADRCAEAVSKLNAVATALREAKDFNEEQMEDINSFCDELESAAGEAEGVEFPGMYS